MEKQLIQFNKYLSSQGAVFVASSFPKKEQRLNTGMLCHNGKLAFLWIFKGNRHGHNQTTAISNDLLFPS